MYLILDDLLRVELTLALRKFVYTTLPEESNELRFDWMKMLALPIRFWNMQMMILQSNMQLSGVVMAL
jgi:hypothetical protein